MSAAGTKHPRDILSADDGGYTLPDDASGRAQVDAIRYLEALHGRRVIDVSSVDEGRKHIRRLILGHPRSADEIEQALSYCESQGIEVR